MITNLRVLALICFILPVATVIISYILSIKLNLVPSCIPNFEGCSSISRAGRYPPVKYFFKPMMYLYAVSLLLYWFYFFQVLKKINIKKNYIFWLALFSVLFLCLYVLFLGESKIYSFFKRIGIYVYILFTVVSQYLISNLLIKNKKKINKYFYFIYCRTNFYLTFFLLISGIILLPILIVKIENFPEIKNIISWNYFFLIQLYFLISYFSLKKLNYPTSA
tara:strand:- start:592 stop:1254 length:663 start_codon:yes stop_codon:yes gene_type:complete